MTQPKAQKPKEKALVFEKVQYDPLQNPAVFGLADESTSNTTSNTIISSPVNVDSGWESDEKKVDSIKKKKEEVEIKEDEASEDNEEEYNFEKIDANIQRAKKKKKVDFRKELTSDSQDIDDLLLFQTKETNETEKIKQIDQELLYVLLCYMFYILALYIFVYNIMQNIYKKGCCR